MLQDHSHCPHCNAVEEGTTFVLQCQNKTVVDLWQKEVESLTLWIQKRKGGPRDYFKIFDSNNS